MTKFLAFILSKKSWDWNRWMYLFMYLDYKGLTEVSISWCVNHGQWDTIDIDQILIRSVVLYVNRVERPIFSSGVISSKSLSGLFHLNLAKIY